MRSSGQRESLPTSLPFSSSPSTRSVRVRTLNSQQHSMKLSEVPSDILVLVLSHLDFPSLSHLVRTHSSFNSVWKSYPEHLSRAICIRNGLADSKTLSAAAPLQAEGWHKRGGLEKEPSPEELEDVIKEQRSMTGAFDGVKTWRDYGESN